MSGVMMREFLVPLCTLCACAVAGIAGLDRLCLFYQTYQSMLSTLESERWLLQQCSDPHFFSKMHQHSDLCFQVENNARVGAFMLALRQFTQSMLLPQLVVDSLTGASSRLSWPLICLLGVGLLFGPSFLVRNQARRRWVSCTDGHYKDA